MHAVTQTVQIRGILMTSISAAYTVVVAYDRFARHKNFRKKEIKNMSKLSICKQNKTFIGACSYQLFFLLKYILQEMQAAGNIILAGPDDSFGPVVARNSEVLVSNLGHTDVCYRICAYIVLQILQRSGVRSVVYGILCTIKNR